MASLAVVTAGIMYVAYGFLPRQDYLPTSLAVTAVAGVVVYVILDRLVQL